MTVYELQQFLKQFPPDAEVLFLQSGGDIWEPVSFTTVLDPAQYMQSEANGYAFDAITQYYPQNPVLEASATLEVLGERTHRKAYQRRVSNAK